MGQLAIHALVLIRLTDKLLVYYTRTTPSINQEFVGLVLGAMERMRKTANLVLENGDRRAA